MNKKINSISALALILSFFIGAFSICFADSTKGFKDLNSDNWAYEAINSMTRLGIISGYTDGSFRPNKYVTYGEFIKMVAITGNIVEKGLTAKGDEHWAKPFYDASLNNFYFSEWDIKKNALDIPIPRKHMALVISGAMGRKADIDHEDYREIQRNISDVDHNTPCEYEIIKAYAAGVLSGYPDGTFKPKGTLTRAEASIVIMLLQNMLENNNEMKSNACTCEDSNIAEILKLDETVNIYRDDINDLVAVEENPIGFTEGTIDFRMFNYAENKEKRHVELLRLLKNHFPGEGAEMCKMLIEFAAKPMGEDQQAIRKQYFGAHPVLMERHGGIVGMYVFPIGYDGKYWNVSPGQVQEEFF